MRGEKAIPQSKYLELKRIRELMVNFPEIREDEVLDMKSLLLEAGYKVRPELVAEKIIQHVSCMSNTSLT